MDIKKIDGVLTLVSVEMSDLKNDGTVLIPTSVRTIGKEAFRRYTGLTSITLPAGVTSIEAWAFADCTSLTSITLPPGVISIEERAFHCCTSLTSITLRAGITLIEGHAFFGCTSLTSITLPAGVTSIGWFAFYGCTSLTSITLPAGVISIGLFAFYGCTSLTSIKLPAGVTSIEGHAFSDCTGLTSITLPTGVASIEESVFHGCAGLTSITLPSGVTSIKEGAFRGCSSLTSIKLPSGVTKIKKRAFYDCPNLTHILINTDKLEELERIKQLLPGDVKEKVAINPVFLEAMQLQRELLGDFSATIYPAALLSSSVFLTNEMAKEIFSYNELDTAPVLSLKKAFEKEPVPDSPDSFAAYQATLAAIKHQHIFAAQCEALIPLLQQYNKIIQETVPAQYSGFFSSNRMPSNANNVAMLNTYKLVERLIDSLKKHTIPCLSAEEQETLFSRPALLAKIPVDVRKKMGLDLPLEQGRSSKPFK